MVNYIQMLKNLSKFIGLLTVLTISSVLFGSGKAHAATLTVAAGTGSAETDNLCQLNEALISINTAQDNSDDCIHTGAAYGTNDTINLPSGTITLSADLPTIGGSAQNLSIIGVSTTASIIDGANHVGFNSNIINKDQLFQKFKMINAKDYAIRSTGNKSITLDRLEIANSGTCTTLLAVSAVVSNTIIHGCSNSTLLTDNSGLYIKVDALANTDIPSISVSDSKVYDCSSIGHSSGVVFQVGDATSAGQSISLERFIVTNNQSDSEAGVYLDAGVNPSLLDLIIDAVTVANNSVTPTVAATDPNEFNPTYTSGFHFSVKNLSPRMNLTNVTVANNESINTVDSHLAIAGFFGLLVDASEQISVVNTTVVGNKVTQSNVSAIGRIPAFFLARVVLGENGPTSIGPGGSAQNSLIAHNKHNDSASNCRSDIDGSFTGLNGIYDLTPTNEGNNMSDDQTCTGYRYEPTLYDTIDHDVADNGGPVPTIKLLPGSPAINAGGQVLGITTDARGVSRSGYYSVGAYQGVLPANTTTPNGGGSLAKTGAIAVSAIILGGIIVATCGYIVYDYRKHKAVLVAIDPHVRYSLPHHMKLVSLPLFKYRISLSLSKPTKYSHDGVHKF